MTFFGLIASNLAARRLRSALTGGAVAIAVMAVVALGTLTVSLKESATGILQVGNADLTLAQKHGDSLLNSTIAVGDIAEARKVPGVQQVVGALVQVDRYDAANPGVIQVGLAPSAQRAFGVVVLEGRSYRATAEHQVMLGYALAESIHKQVGDQLRMDDHTYRVTGLYRTNISFGNSTMMFPLPVLQDRYQKAGLVTLGFVKVTPAAEKARVKVALDRRLPQLSAVASESDYGLVDDTLVLISAANTGGSILAGLIAITGVLNTSLLSFFERTREFGVLRSIGWSRGRILALVIGEAVVVSLLGAVVGLVLGWGAINGLQHLAALRGVFHPIYDTAVFVRSLVFAFAVAFVGALYPAVRAATLAPVEAMRHE